MKLTDFSLIEGFEWDKGNLDKNWTKHNVKPVEIEEVFFNEPILIAYEKRYSDKELRFAVIIISNESRKLF